MKLLNTFKHYGYSNQIGPGVYDIHSPRVPHEKEIKDRLKAMLDILPSDLLFVNPVSETSREQVYSLFMPSIRTAVSRLVVGKRQKVSNRLPLCEYQISQAMRY